MSRHIRTFESFQGKRRNIETVNETVIQRDSSFIVGGIKVDKKTISAYAKKVKDQTSKDIKSMYSEMEIAEELVKWSVNSLENIDNVPVSALMGGEEEMAQDLDMNDDETSFDETGESDGEMSMENDSDAGQSSDDLDMNDEESGDEELDLDVDTNLDDFESPDGEESSDENSDEESDNLDLEDENSDEEEDLPI